MNSSVRRVTLAIGVVAMDNKQTFIHDAMYELEYEKELWTTNKHDTISHLTVIQSFIHDAIYAMLSFHVSYRSKYCFKPSNPRVCEKKKLNIVSFNVLILY